MLKYPLDPPHARILIASFSLGCSSEIIDILSLINSGPLFIDRSSDRESAALSRAKFIHRDGDHLTALNVLRAYIDLKTQDNKGVGKWLKDNHVNGKTIQHALKVREQLRELARRDGVDPGLTCGSESEVVGRCLLRGLFMNTAIVQSDGSYRQTAGSLVSLSSSCLLDSFVRFGGKLITQIVKIHPSSVLMSKKVPAILYDELVSLPSSS
jgi:HrpA-like RNA helicase